MSDQPRFAFKCDGKTVDCRVKPEENPRWYFCVDGSPEQPGPLAYENDELDEVRAIIQEILDRCDDETDQE